MTEPSMCATCGSPLPAEMPPGMCPKCLLRTGFESQPAVPATQPSPAASGFVPPSLETIASRFPQLEVLELLGKGGMGAVYKARQPALDRLVAVKVLPPEVGQDAAFAERFTREARALARLSHPNIVAVHDFGQAGGLFYFIMEYVDGANLRAALQSGALTAKDALAVVPQVCDALQFAHDEGVVHRDIKPENILIDRRGRVKIADFGLAKLLGQEQDQALTGTHQIMGTLKYMAPEQLEGAKEVDHRADIYSLGVVFYELLTGELPLGRFAPPSKKVQVDVRLDEVVLRALEKEPQQRYQQVSQVKTDVQRIQETATAAPSTAAPVPDEVVRRRIGFFAVAGMLAAVGMFLALQAGYLAGADWYFKNELPRNYLTTGFNLAACWSAFFLAYWWYLLAKDPRTPRSLADFQRVAQTPDPRALRIWSPLLRFAGVCLVIVVASWRFGDFWQTLAVSVPVVLGPFVAMAALWHAYRPGRGEKLAPPVAAPRSAASTPASSRPRPWLVPVLAGLNLVLALLLMLVSSMKDPAPFDESVPQFWQTWYDVSSWVAFGNAAFTFVACVGIFLWQPWSRKLLVATCVFALLHTAAEVPYLAQAGLPQAFLEIQKEFGAMEGAAEFADVYALGAVLLILGGLVCFSLPWNIANAVYFTRPQVVAAFEPPGPANA